VKGFTLIESMVSIAIAGLALAGSLALFSTSTRQAQRQERELVAFTIAQQKIELLSSVPKGSPLLAQVEVGDVNDPSLFAGVDGPLPALRRVDGFGDPRVDGEYVVYWKVEPEFGSLSRVRVYVRFPPVDVEANHVVLETLR
jgi:prepilin-type N-terminal cleavage/methylation domain-containing protein